MTAGASSISDNEAIRVLNFQYGNGTPATLYAALLTDTNTVAQRRAGTYTEVSTAVWTNYARVAITNNTTNFPNATGANPAVKSSGSDFVFASSGSPATTTANVTCPAIAIFDSPTIGAGNIKGFYDFVDGSNNQVPVIVQNGNEVKIPSGVFQVKL